MSGLLYFKTKLDSKDDRREKLIIAEICSYEDLAKDIFGR